MRDDGIVEAVFRALHDPDSDKITSLPLEVSSTLAGRRR